MAEGVGSMVYCPPRLAGKVDLRLDANESPVCAVDVGEVARAIGAAGWGRYPDVSGLERAIADRLGVEASRVVVTAGADGCIERVVGAWVGEGDAVACARPTFEMIGRYVARAGGRLVGPAWWEGAYPAGEVCAALEAGAALGVVVSPNNPTGGAAGVEDLERVSRSAGDRVVLADLAYAEYASEDLTWAALALPNVVVVRTFSKAWGLAGLRVGYGVGPSGVMERVRAAGSPYPVSSVSAAACLWALERGEGVMRAHVARVREERAALARAVEEVGGRALASGGNFVLAGFADAEGVWRRLWARGIAVRWFGRGSGLEGFVRITCPGEARAMDRLVGALREAARGEEAER